jgi:small conductance mechanosensitive channel
MNWYELIKGLPLFALMRIATLFACIPVLFVITHLISKFMRKHTSRHVAQLISELFFYIGVAVLVVTLLHEFGFNVSALLGAAGIFGIAVGFAAQTSISNIISGIFLLFEHPFVIGDIIICEGQKGVVESIGLLSIKLRTANGMLIRIANEDLIKKVVINQSYFPKQFMSFTFQSQPDKDIQHVLNFIKDCINEVQIILKEPAPIIAVNDYSQFSVNFSVSICINTADRLKIYEKLLDKIKQKGKEQGLYLAIKQNY